MLVRKERPLSLIQCKKYAERERADKHIYWFWGQGLLWISKRAKSARAINPTHLVIYNNMPISSDDRWWWQWVHLPVCCVNDCGTFYYFICILGFGHDNWQQQQYGTIIEMDWKDPGILWNLPWKWKTVETSHELFVQTSHLQTHTYTHSLPICTRPVTRRAIIIGSPITLASLALVLSLLLNDVMMMIVTMTTLPTHTHTRLKDCSSLFDH